MGTPKLQVENLSFAYVDRRRGSKLLVLKDINLEISEGEFVSIVGPSGCGKSTLLQIIDGLMFPTNGKVLVDGNEVHSPGPDRAMVFQFPYLLPWRTVLSNVTLGLEIQQNLQGKSHREYEESAKQLLKMVGLKGFENYHPQSLSGGMQQRVNLARALAVNPSLLLMDEPFASLDAQTREIMQEELLRIYRETKKTIIFVTHQTSEAVYLSNKVVIMSSRPGTLTKIIAIDLDNRSLEAKRTEKFVKYEEMVWKSIEDEVRKSIYA